MILSLRCVDSPPSAFTSVEVVEARQEKRKESRGLMSNLLCHHIKRAGEIPGRNIEKGKGLS